MSFSVKNKFGIPPSTDLQFFDDSDTVIDDEVIHDFLRLTQMSVCWPKMRDVKIVQEALEMHAGGQDIMEEYRRTKTLTHSTRRHLVNILVSHMVEKHGRVPVRMQREKYGLGIVTLFPNLRDPFSTKGYINQDVTLLFGEDTSSKLLEKWDSTFKCKIIEEARCLTQTPTVRHLLMSAENQDTEPSAEWDSDIATLLLLVHLLPPQPIGKKAAKISADAASERLVVYHKSCCSFEEALGKRDHHHPYLLAVGRNQNRTDQFYIALDKKLIPCEAASAVGAFDELFKLHFVFNLAYDDTLNNFYTFVQTTVYNIDIGKTKESPRVREFRAKLLN
ncbi:uncharacterized protein LOC125302829 [Alosa alosa]|uniref:uncharacterized protein LOC125302829 n=1 Tax=Alosa alosa TaxID=278164 RepID=UPI0020154F85|nr:uncharacterized protein LOC125302829 [Alosa alosa]